MYAIVNIAGQQYKVEKDQKLFVHRLEQKEGESVSFDKVLLIDNDKNVVVGDPTIKGAMISGKVLSHPRGDKVKVFKKKRRKGYKVQTGHRQDLTEIQIEEIIEKGAVKEAAPAKQAAGKTASADKGKEAAAKSTAKTTTAKPAAKKPAAKPAPKKDIADPAESKTAAKKPATAKTAAKKPATAKTAAKKPAAAKPAPKKPAPKKPAAKKPDAGKERKE
jgi:large subunit ribosomal protein L21